MSSSITREADVADSTTESVQPVDLEEIFAALDAPYSGVLPKRALRQLQARRDEATPRLTQMIRRATDQIRSGDAPQGDGHLYALYLLAEFRAVEALPAILEAVSLPGDGAHELFGDGVTEDLDNILATLAVESPGALDDLIADRSVDEYVRWAAASSLLYWVRDGRLSRAEAVKRLRSPLRAAIDAGDAEGVGFLVSELFDYSPRGAEAEIEEAFQRELVDPTLIGRQDFHAAMEAGEEHHAKALARCRPTGIKDTVVHLASWHCFQPQKPSRPPPRNSREFSDEFGEADETVVHPSPRVGRNAPCPCGSGKKFKKCCLNR